MTASDKEIGKIDAQIAQSNYISRDLSWLQFNYRVLDQAKKSERSIFERLKFLAITASNLDEFFMIRVGSLYNYIEYNRKRIDYSGLREMPFKKKLFEDLQKYMGEQHRHFSESLQPEFAAAGFQIVAADKLSGTEKKLAADYFSKTIFPMLTPMVFDSYHPFPILMNKMLVFGVVTRTAQEKRKKNRKLSFVQVPQNLPRFFEIQRDDQTLFVPIEEIIRTHIGELFRNIVIDSVDLFRITRDGEFSLEENEDMDSSFIEEMNRKLKTRRTGRVVRLEIGPDYSGWMMRTLQAKWRIDDENVFLCDTLIDYSGLMEIAFHEKFLPELPLSPPGAKPSNYVNNKSGDIFRYLRKRDMLLYHPFHDIEPVLNLLEEAAVDPAVLAIKITIYRLSKKSRVSAALLKAAENGKHVSVLFEVKARFDEENNIAEAKRLQKAGCFVIYGVINLKTHTKLMMVVRKEPDKIRRYVHMSTGNYNESTSKIYTDLGLMSTNEQYAKDISEFFNAITGHSEPSDYRLLLTAPDRLRNRLISLVDKEIENAKNGFPSGIVIKVNSLQDNLIIEALYRASQAGVQVKLIVRGICCLRPGRKNLSENIKVYSVVGNLLEHSRVYYFHNYGEPLIYSGSADAMVRSFDRRIESLFLITDKFCKQQVVHILRCNLADNYNTFEMQEDATYLPVSAGDNPVFDSHHQLFGMRDEDIEDELLF